LPFHDFSTILLINFFIDGFSKKSKNLIKKKKIKEKEFSEHCDN
jgi:hypothetical protein